MSLDDGSYEDFYEDDATLWREPAQKGKWVFLSSRVVLKCHQQQFANAQPQFYSQVGNLLHHQSTLAVRVPGSLKAPIIYSLVNVTRIPYILHLIQQTTLTVTPLQPQDSIITIIIIIIIASILATKKRDPPACPPSTVPIDTLRLICRLRQHRLIHERLITYRLTSVKLMLCISV